MKWNRGFTLIELLVVVAIIGILAAVGVTAYNGYTNSAKVNTTKSNHNTMVKYTQTVLTLCAIENKVSMLDRNGKAIDITISNRYGEGERNFYLAVENQSYFIDKDYARLVNSINAKYSLLRFYKNKASILYWEDKRAQLTSNNKNREDLSIMIQEAEKMVERNRDLITIN